LSGARKPAFGIEVASFFAQKIVSEFWWHGCPSGITWEEKMPGPPRGDVFAEMKGCIDQGIGGRPSLARFVEVTYEAILELKRQLDELRSSRSQLGLKRKPGKGKAASERGQGA
jgi:hypothetical protein